jgi:hypothetical protein
MPVNLFPLSLSNLEYDMICSLECAVSADRWGYVKLFFSRAEKGFSAAQSQLWGYAGNKSVDIIVARHPRFSLDRTGTRQFQFSLRFLLLRVDRWVQFFIDLLWGLMLTCPCIQIDLSWFLRAD